MVFAFRKARKIPLMKKGVIKDINDNSTGSEWMPTVESICGIPVVTKYKYLGTYFDSKLTMDT